MTNVVPLVAEVDELLEDAERAALLHVRGVAGVGQGLVDDEVAAEGIRVGATTAEEVVGGCAVNVWKVSSAGISSHQADVGGAAFMAPLRSADARGCPRLQRAWP